MVSGLQGTRNARGNEGDAAACMLHSFLDTEKAEKVPWRSQSLSHI